QGLFQSQRAAPAQGAEAGGAAGRPSGPRFLGPAVGDEDPRSDARDCRRVPSGLRPCRAVQFGWRGDGSERIPPPGTRPGGHSATLVSLVSGLPPISDFGCEGKYVKRRSSVAREPDLALFVKIRAPKAPILCLSY